MLIATQLKYMKINCSTLTLLKANKILFSRSLSPGKYNKHVVIAKILIWWNYVAVNMSDIKRMFNL